MRCIFHFANEQHLIPDKNERDISFLIICGRNLCMCIYEVGITYNSILQMNISHLYISIPNYLVFLIVTNASRCSQGDAFIICR